MQIFSNYEKEVRPWGNFERFTLNEQSTVKVITIEPNQELSLQQHEHRTESWHILRGNGTVTIGDEKLPANVGDEFKIECGQKHRISGGQDGMQFLEIAFGQFDENDITRLEDRYGR